MEKEKWRFIVLLGKGGISFFSEGLLKSYGILLPALAIQLQASYTVVGLIATVQFTATFLLSPFAQMLNQRLGPQPTSLTGGMLAGGAICLMYFAQTPLHIGILFAIAGLGFGMLFQTAYVVLKDHFGDDFGSANTLSVMGTVIGIAALPMLTKELYEAYGLHGTFLVLGALTCNLIAVGGTMRYRRGTAGMRSRDSDYMAVRSSEPEESTKNEDQDSITDHCKSNETSNDIPCSEHTERSCRHFPGSVMECVCRFLLELFAIDAIKNERLFACFFFPCQLLMDCVYIGYTIFLVSYGLSIGIDPTLAPYLTVASAGGGVIARILLAILLHLKPGWSPQLYVVSNTIVTVGFFFFPASKSFLYAMCCSVVVGLGLQGCTASYHGAMGILVGPDNFPGIIAVSFFGTGLISAGTGATVGYLYEVMQSFETVFMLLGSMTAVIVILSSIYLCIRRKDSTAG
ncbi:monocarboxylate transporter 3-like [Diadema antillarum]|uniref:monocarboxylate transporter 3-like n=1 Tax=Diadema antillarum TaxID=105358 RepID=UPI003A88CEF1